MSKILCCAQDAAGGRCVSHVPIALGGRVPVVFACSPTSQGYWDDECTRYCLDHVDPFHRRRSLENLIDEIMPTLVVVGTTGDMSIDKWAVEMARERGIYSIGILDEWYDYASRFDLLRSGEKFLPDIVLCPDEFAKSEARREGLPLDRLQVCTLPLYDIADDSYQSTWDDDVQRRNMLFVSETHARDFGQQAGESGPLGQYLGYSEIDVRRDIYNCIGSLPQRIHVSEKLHPSSTCVYENFSQTTNLTWEIHGIADLEALIRQSYLVIGMRSAVLLQALAMGARVVSYQPGLLGDNKCTAARRFNIPSFLEKEAFGYWLANVIEDPNHYSFNGGREELYALVDQSKHGHDTLQTIILNHMGV